MIYLFFGIYINGGCYEETCIDIKLSASRTLEKILDFVMENGLPPVYIIIDEYDNFANQLIVSHKDELYRALTSDDSFFKTFFKTIKEGRKAGAISNIFITGVLPITIDDLASGFNIAHIDVSTKYAEMMQGFVNNPDLPKLFADYWRLYISTIVMGYLSIF
ncbi:MAG: AAA family ATPase [Desulfobacterales bacterium]|nr:AAA family ATPase [Desulfobacterales bacterium]